MRLESFLKDLATKNSAWMSYDTTDFVSEEGKPFPYVYLSTSSNASAGYATSGKLRVCAIAMNSRYML